MPNTGESKIMANTDTWRYSIPQRMEEDRPEQRSAGASMPNLTALSRRLSEAHVEFNALIEGAVGDGLSVEAEEE
jgi:hypothetical protein